MLKKGLSSFWERLQEIQELFPFENMAENLEGVPMHRDVIKR